MVERRQTKRRRCRGDDGAAMVEGAVVAFPFFLLIFGAIEYGFLFKDYLTLANATRAAARTASAEADHQGADYRILVALDEGAAGLQRENIKRIVFFKSTDDGTATGKPSPDGTVPSACLSGSPLLGGVSGLCNVYTPNDFLLTQDQFNCKTGTSPGLANDDDWCPTTREAYLYDPCKPSANQSDGTDYIGIYIEYDHTYVTGLFSTSKHRTLTDTTVIRIEPQGLSRGGLCS